MVVWCCVLKLFDTLRLERPRAILKNMERAGRGGAEQQDSGPLTHGLPSDAFPPASAFGRGESELGSLAKEYIFRVLLCQDLLMDKVSEKEKTQRAQVINKMVGHAPGAENALHIPNLEQEHHCCHAT